jgi:hypothetical protein
MKHNIPWPRLLAESGLIVLSILLAFGIEAWWAGRAERASEAAMVVGIAQDFESHREILRVRIEQYGERLTATERLLDSVGPQAEGLNEMSLRDLGVVGMAGPVQFQGGTLETLIATDGLSLLRDERLRVHLTRWMQGAEDLEALNGFVNSEATLLLGYLRTRYSLQDLDRLAGATELPPSGFEPGLDASPRDIEFANVIYQQHYATTILLGSLRNLATIADSVLARVDG